MCVTLTASHPEAREHHVSHPPMKRVKGDKCMKPGKRVINVTSGKHINPADA